MAAQDKLKHYKPLQVLAGSSAFAIAPHDTDELPYVTSKIYVGGAGDITLILRDDSTPVLLKAVPVGTILDLRVKAVMATGTTATLLVGII